MNVFSRQAAITVGDLDAQDYASDCIAAIRTDLVKSTFHAYVQAGYVVNGDFFKGKHASMRVVELDFAAATAALDYSDLSAIHAMIETKEAAA